MHHVIKVVFRTIKHGDWKGDLECVYSDVHGDGMETVNDGSRYSNEWYLNDTRPATVVEYSAELDSMNANGLIQVVPNDDTYEFIPVRKRMW